jgi:hypothetical protein
MMPLSLQRVLHGVRYVRGGNRHLIGDALVINRPDCEGELVALVLVSEAGGFATHPGSIANSFALVTSSHFN